MTDSSSAVLLEHGTRGPEVDQLAGAFLAGYSSAATRDTYRDGLKQWLAFCAGRGVDPLTVRRTHVEVWMRHLEGRGLANATRAIRLSSVKSFYGWLYDEEFIDGNPAGRVRPPPDDSTPQPAMNRHELHRFMVEAQRVGGYRHATVAVMVYCATRVGETCAADVGDLDVVEWVPRLTLRTKGDKRRVAVVPPPAMQALQSALDGRRAGPLLLNEAGNRMRRANVAGYIDTLAKRADIDKALTTHSLRRTAIQVALDDGRPLRDVQRWVDHADPATTARYDDRPLAPDESPSWSIMQAVA